MNPEKEAATPDFEARKREFFTNIGISVRQALKEHSKGGLWDRETGSSKRSWGNVSEHCLVEVARSSVLAEALNLPGEIQTQLITAAAVHDAFKKREKEIASAANLSWDGFEQASTEFKKQLQEAGFDETVIGLAHSVGHGSLLAMEEILAKDELTPEDIATLAMHYIDDYTLGSGWTTPVETRENGERINNLDKRIDSTELNPRYALLNEEGRQHLHGESSFEAQRRIGHLVEQRIAALLAERSGQTVDPLELPEWIDQEIRQRINNP